MKIKLFGSIKEHIGVNELEVTDTTVDSVASVKSYLLSRFPELSIISQSAIAVNEEYATDELQLQDSDEIAIIPPVSGG